MFSQLKNIDTAFKHIKRFSIALIACATLLSGFISYKSFEMARRAHSTIWVMTGGELMQTTAALRKENLPIEARGHVAIFHRLFFTLDPDEEAITSGVTKALYLADGSAKRQYDNLKESGYYAGLIAGNISQRVTVDSVQLDMRTEPYYFKCFATEELIRSSSVTTRTLITEGYLRNLEHRTDRNRHGFLIERWQVLENRTISTRGR